MWMPRMTRHQFLRERAVCRKKHTSLQTVRSDTTRWTSSSHAAYSVYTAMLLLHLRGAPKSRHPRFRYGLELAETRMFHPIFRRDSMLSRYGNDGCSYA